jgi:uncharacterized protein YbaR (Trm112 family)
MRKKLLDILCCPVCKGDLLLIITEENNDEIVTGSLRCIRCSREYPIEEGIPDLLPRDSGE